jgi:hypothetical protein
VWRALEEITPGALGGIAVARARARAQVWRRIVARRGRIPPAGVAGGIWVAVGRCEVSETSVET